MHNRLATLQRCRIGVLTLQSLCRQRERLMEIATDVSPHYSLTPRGGTGDDLIAATVARRQALLTDILALERSVMDDMSAAQRIVLALHSPLLQSVARDYWLSGMTINDIAAQSGITSNAVSKTKRRVERMLDDAPCA